MRNEVGQFAEELSEDSEDGVRPTSAEGSRRSSLGSQSGLFTRSFSTASSTSLARSPLAASVSSSENLTNDVHFHASFRKVRQYCLLQAYFFAVVKSTSRLDVYL